jgi:butyrate kinase
MADKIEMPNTFYNERLDSVGDLVEIAGRLKASTVAVSGGHRPEDLQLVESARDHGIVDRIILVGDKRLISQAVTDVGIEISKQDLIPADSDEEIAAATVCLIKEEAVDIVLKGGISTPVINRYMLQIAVRSTVSLASIFDASPIADGRPIILTDAGVTTVCNFGRLVGIIENAVEVSRVVMGIPRPKVAVLSANEKQIASLPSTQLGMELAGRSWGDAVVYGPLSFDLATDPGSVDVKGVPDVPAAREVAGRADILVCPSIDAANILYKAVTAMTKYGQASIAGITVGFQVPYVILSRADTLDTRLNSVALCSVYSQRRAASKPTLRYKKAEEIDSYSVATVRPGMGGVKIALFESGKPVYQGEVPYSGRGRNIESVANSIIDRIKGLKVPCIDACAVYCALQSETKSGITAGTYIVAEKKGDRVAVDERLVSAAGVHRETAQESSIAAPLIAALSVGLGVSGFITFTSADELIPEAVVSGYARVTRKVGSSALSIIAAAKRGASSLGRPWERVNLVVATIGEETAVAAVERGRIVDTAFSALGDGPFSLYSAGGLPTAELVDLCYSGDFDREELLVELTKKAGLASYLEEHRIGVIEKRIAEGDGKAHLLIGAMVYQVAKEIGAMYTVMGGTVEAIVLTGELVSCRIVKDQIRRRISSLAPVIIFEGSLELEELAGAVTKVLSGREKPLRYR